MALLPIRIPKLSQTIAFVDSSRKLTNEALKRLNDAFSGIQASVNGVVAALDAAAAAQATADSALAMAGGPHYDQSITIGSGTFSIDQILIVAGGSLNVQARITVGAAGAGGTLDLDIDYSISGSGTWVNIASNSQSYGAGDPAAVGANGSFTNMTGADRLYDVRSVVSGVGGTVNQSRSYLRAYY